MTDQHNELALATGDQDYESPPLTGRLVTVQDAVAPYPEDESIDVLTAWLAIPPAERQLSDILVDIPRGADERLGIEWAWREAIIVDEGGLGDYPWVGLRFPGVGVLGPFAVDPGTPTTVIGFGPADHPVEVIVWQHDPVEGDPTAVEVITTVDDWPGVAGALGTVDPPALVVNVREDTATVQLLDRASS